MTNNQNKALADFASTLVKKGGECALQWFRKPFDIDVKGDSSPVTQADRTAESLVRKLINDQYPEHGILGEEFGNEDLDGDFVWSIDPIDGTRSFITGSPIWGTQVSLLRKGKALTGAVAIPALDELWSASVGEGSWYTDRYRNRSQCSSSTCKTLGDARFYTTSLLYFEPIEKEMAQVLLKTVGTPLFGGDCYSYCLLASGFVDLVVESQLKPFDYLPLITIISEAGGVITDWQGEPLTMHSNGKVVAAATPQLHQETLAFLREHGC